MPLTRSSTIEIVLGFGSEYGPILRSYPIGKSQAVWDSVRLWCREHPGAYGSIATPEGMFTIVFKTPAQLTGTDPSSTPAPEP